MEFLKLIALQLVSPLKFSLLLLLIAVVLQLLNRKRGARALKISSLAWLLLWSQPYASDVLLHFVEYKPLRNKLPEQAPDYIFVLACYYSTQGNVSEISRWSECSLQRNVEAARLHIKTNAPILVTGGNFLHDKSVNYGDKARLLFSSLNINDQNIIVTRSGTTTHDEITSALPFIKNKNIWVVSSATHIHRIKKELESVSTQASYFPVDYHSKSSLTPYVTLPSQKALENTRHALYEVMAVIKQNLSN